MMEYTFTLPGAFAVFIGGCGAVITISNAIKAVAAWRDAVKKPDADQDAKISALDSRLTTVERKLDNDNKRLEDAESLRRIELRALLALTRHSLDGNNITDLKAAEADLQNYLVEK